MYEPPYLLPDIPRQHSMISTNGFIESHDFVQNVSGWRIESVETLASDSDTGSYGQIFSNVASLNSLLMFNSSGNAYHWFSSTNLDDGAAYVWLGASNDDSAIFLGSDLAAVRYDKSDTAIEFHVSGQRTAVSTSGMILTTCAVGTGTNVEINGFAVLVKDTSSIRYKNVADVNMADYLTPSMIDSLQPKMWSYKNDTSNHPQISLIAEEANGVSPFLITNEFDDDDNVIPAGLSTKGLISLLIIALKDARTRITALES